jgi:hypothetical protein
MRLAGEDEHRYQGQPPGEPLHGAVIVAAAASPKAGIVAA